MRKAIQLESYKEDAITSFYFLTTGYFTDLYIQGQENRIHFKIKLFIWSLILKTGYCTVICTKKVRKTEDTF